MRPISKGLDIPHAQLVIRKGFNPKVDSYSAFIEADGKLKTGLDGYLKGRGIKTIFVTGLATDFCVAWTANDARKLGLNAYVIEDACRGIDTQGSLAAAWNNMQKAGVKRVQSTDSGAGGYRPFAGKRLDYGDLSPRFRRALFTLSKADIPRRRASVGTPSILAFAEMALRLLLRRSIHKAWHLDVRDEQHEEVERGAEAGGGTQRGWRRGIDFDELPGYVGYQVRRTQAKIFADFEATLANVDFTPGSFGVLTLIRANPGITQVALAAAFGVDKSTMSPVIVRLEKRGLVRREVLASDRRCHALYFEPTRSRSSWPRARRSAPSRAAWPRASPSPSSASWRACSAKSFKAAARAGECATAAPLLAVVRQAHHWVGGYQALHSNKVLSLSKDGRTLRLAVVRPW